MVTRVFPGGSDGKASAYNVGDPGSISGSEDLEKEMATHSSIRAWRISRTEESGGLQSIGCKELDMTEGAYHVLFYVHIIILCHPIKY